MLEGEVYQPLVV